MSYEIFILRQSKIEAGEFFSYILVMLPYSLNAKCSYLEVLVRDIN